MAGPRDQSKRRWSELVRNGLAKGLLSAVLLAQAMQAVAGPSVPDLPTQTPAPVAQSDRTDNSPSPGTVKWSAPSLLDKTPQIIDPLGVLSGAEPRQALDDWRQADVSNGAMLAMVQSLVLTQSPVIAIDPAAAERARIAAEQTRALLDNPTPAQALILAEQKNVYALEQAGVLPKLTHVVNYRTFANPGAADQGHELEAVIDYWQRMGQASYDQRLPTAYEGVTRPTLDQAAQALTSAVQEAGFASVRVPLPMWENPAGIMALADQIKQANQEMQQLTGWDGQVMGLQGRVHWVIGTPYDTAITQHLGDGTYVIQSTFDDYVHEHIHAVEMAMADDMGWTPGDAMPAMVSHLHPHAQAATAIAEPVRPQRERHSPADGIERTWNSLVSNLHVVSASQPEGGWVKQMNDRARSIAEQNDNRYKPEEQDYPRDTHERVAFVAAAVATEMLGRDSILGHPRNLSEGLENPRESGLPIFGPGAAEAAAQRAGFEHTFASLNVLWWGERPSLEDSQVVAWDEVPAPVEAVFETCNAAGECVQEPVEILQAAVEQEPPVQSDPFLSAEQDESVYASIGGGEEVPPPVEFVFETCNAVGECYQEESPDWPLPAKDPQAAPKQTSPAEVKWTDLQVNQVEAVAEICAAETGQCREEPVEILQAPVQFEQAPEFRPIEQWKQQRGSKPAPEAPESAAAVSSARSYGR